MLTIFTPVARPSLSGDGIDSYLYSSPLDVPGLVSADLCLRIFKASMNGADGGSAGLGQVDHCLYSITSGPMLFPPSVPHRGLQARGVVYYLSRVVHNRTMNTTILH